MILLQKNKQISKPQTFLCQHARHKLHKPRPSNQIKHISMKLVDIVEIVENLESSEIFINNIGKQNRQMQSYLRTIIFMALVLHKSLPVLLFYYP